MEKVKFGELKVGNKYFQPILSDTSINECTIESIDSNGKDYIYSYKRWDGDIVRTCASKYEGRYTINDKLTLFNTRDEAKDYLRKEFEEKLKLI